jgi:ligand-binding sensor protein
MKYKLQDLIDIIQFQELQDRLNEIYSFPSSIIDNDGNILTATAWQEVCTKFHRKNKESEKVCMKSDLYILNHLHEANPAVSYRCPHGLVDIALPIIIDGIHYGNFFTGQFFLEEPDLDFFRCQAQKYGFDEEAYIEAIKKVPIWAQEQVDSYLFYIEGLMSVISENGLKRVKEIESRKQIQRSEKKYRSILKAALDGYWLTDISGRILEVNEAYCAQHPDFVQGDFVRLAISDNGCGMDKKILLSLYPNLKWLFMSGYTENIIAHHGVLDEGLNFIQKPFSMQNLSAKVRKVMDEKE